MDDLTVKTAQLAMEVAAAASAAASKNTSGESAVAPEGTVGKSTNAPEDTSGASVAAPHDNTEESPTLSEDNAQESAATPKDNTQESATAPEDTAQESATAPEDTSSAQSVTPRACAVCRKEGKFACHKCAGQYVNNQGEFEFHKKWYCSNECMEKDEERHAKECKFKADQIILQQAKFAGEIAQALFYTFLEKTWVFDIEAFAARYDKAGALINVQLKAGIGHEDGPCGKSYNPRTGGGWLVDFLPQLAQANGIKEAVLTDRQSIWALVTMYKVVGHLFRSLCDNVLDDISEIVHTIKPNYKRLATYIDKKGKPVQRKDLVYNDERGIGVFEIKLRTGTRIALDLCNAQFGGNNHPVMLWPNYWHDYGVKFITRSHLGNTFKIHHNIVHGFNQASHLTVSYYMMEKMHDWIDNISGVNYILFLHQHLFNYEKAKLVDMLTKFLNENLITIDSGLATHKTLPLAINGGLRHPRWVEKSIFVHNGREMVLPDYGPGITHFSWDVIKEIARHKDTKYHDRKEAREMLSCRCVVAPWNDGKILFLKDMLPSEAIPKDRVKENPYWAERRK